ncbi:unnamed protein product [Dibothriocephalus latus]|uniref:Uncharacterized protein n=1 Tax=Dibothriocephalus latus TaxID=60516 RepID=A0A3P7NZY5_DIBLA|nr:unnamed protein product [Dibothriocephalus latus]
MTISSEQLLAILQQQEKQFEAAHIKLMESVMQKFSLHSSDPDSSKNLSTSADPTAASITEFIYDPDFSVTFDTWFKRWEGIFRVDFANADDAWKRLSETFGEKSSLFNIRYQCLKLMKNEADDFLTLASTVNHECERFKLPELTDDQFKCLIFVSALQSPRDAEIWTRLLSTIEQDPKSTLQTLTAECQRLKNLKHDSAIIEKPSSSFAATNVHTVTRTKSVSPISRPRHAL